MAREREQVYFQLECTVGIQIAPEDPQLHLSLPGRFPISIVISSGDPDPKRHLPIPDASAVAVMTVTTKQRVRDAFQRLAQGAMPDGSNVPTDEGFELEDHSEHGLFSIQREWLPTWLSNLMTEAENDLQAAVARVVKLARWRTNCQGQHNPIRKSHILKWSLDGVNWRRTPIDWIFEFGDVRTFRPSTTVREELQRLASEGTVNEPLGHELIREARSQQQHNPRSALVVGLAACEAGVKAFVSNMAPATSWLIENTPSPPLVRLLEEYVPILLRLHNFEGEMKSIPSELIITIKNGVAKRNKIVHGLSASLHHDEIGALIDAIDDTLWLLDYFQGNEWALRYV